MKGVATGDMGVARDGTPQARIPAGDGAARPIHLLRRRRARQPHQGAEADLRRSTRTASRRSTASASRNCGTSIRPSTSPGRVIHTQGWPLDDAWGGGFLYHQANNQVALGLRRRAQLSQPVSLALRGIPALEAASGDPRAAGGRPARLLRRARDQRGRLAVGAEARFPRRRADRLLGGLRERAADQGHATRR